MHFMQFMQNIFASSQLLHCHFYRLQILHVQTTPFLLSECGNGRVLRDTGERRMEEEDGGTLAQHVSTLADKKPEIILRNQRF